MCVSLLFLESSSWKCIPIVCLRPTFGVRNHSFRRCSPFFAFALRQALGEDETRDDFSPCLYERHQSGRYLCMVMCRTIPATTSTAAVTV